MANAIPGTYRDGHIELEAPVDWSDGTRVEVALAGPRAGLTEAEWSDSPEAVAAWLRWYDALEPLEFTPEEEADLAAWRRQLKEYGTAKNGGRIAGLFE